MSNQEATQAEQRAAEHVAGLQGYTDTAKKLISEDYLAGYRQAVEDAAEWPVRHL